MNKLINGILITLFNFSLMVSFSTAETISLPIGEQTKQSNMELPQRGMSKQDVIRDFGDPLEITDAVGKPPISQWLYADYVVYFENDWVLYSVVKHPSGSNKNQEN
jgi:hypothetical protein